MKTIAAVLAFTGLLYVALYVASMEAELRAAHIHAKCVVGCDPIPVLVEVTYVP